MIPAVTNHLWQSTLFAAVAWLLTRALHKNRAHTRYCVWMAASMKFIVPFSLLVALGAHLDWHAAPATAQPRVAFAIEEASQPFVAPVLSSSVAATKKSGVDAKQIIGILWACGVLAVLCQWLLRWFRVRAVLQLSLPLKLNFPVPVRTSTSLLEPGVCGVIRPVLLLPDGIAERLPPEQLQTILAHELSHTRRRDNLTAFLHMLVEAIFWFHPLVWWVGTRLVEERERACDEEVLRLGSEPEVYAEAILNVCKLYVESPLLCMPGVTGSNLRERIEAIMTNPTPVSLTLAKKAALAFVAVVMLVTPVLVGIWKPAAVEAQSAIVDRPVAPVVPSTPMNAVAQTSASSAAPARVAQVPAAPAQAISPPLATIPPEFDAASIKPFTGGGRGGTVQFAPGRAFATGATAYRIILEAYRLKEYQLSRAVPGWLDSDRFMLEAKSETAADESQLRVMLQTLLSKRFNLVVHHETKDLPVYTLVPARGGIKVHEWKKGDPVPPIDRSPGSGIGFVAPWTMESFAGFLNNAAASNHDIDRPVVDKTGLQGVYLFAARVEQNEDLRSAVESQFGLRLEPQKIAMDFLVVDRIEKPSEN